MAINKRYINKKDVRLVALRPQNRGIAKRLSGMNYEETIFPRRGIYLWLMYRTYISGINTE